MKKFLAVMSVLVLTVSLLAKPTNRPNQLEKKCRGKNRPGSNNAV